MIREKLINCHPALVAGFSKTDQTPQQVRGDSTTLRTLLVILFLFLPCFAFALTAEERLTDAAQELRAHEIFKQIRCVVCSGESVNDSKADIAKDMRVLIRKKVSEGNTDQQIIEDITRSYGDTILMKPPFSPNTYLLWLGPVIMFLIGFAVIFASFRRKS